MALNKTSITINGEPVPMGKTKQFIVDCLMDVLTAYARGQFLETLLVYSVLATIGWIVIKNWIGLALRIAGLFY